jgi:uncharacterized surface protein with fasciclin (FAS1) repeats
MLRCAALPKVVALAVPITLGAWTVQAADLVETAKQDGRFNNFLYLLDAAGMAETLGGEGPFTIFAPLDEAFDQLPPDTLDRLVPAEGRRTVEVVVKSHIVADAAIVTGQLLTRAVEVATIGGGTLAIDGTSGVVLLAPIGVTITEVKGQAVVEQKSVAIVVEAPQDSDTNGDRFATLAQQLVGAAAVVAPDIEADNGVIHGIDLVLLPPEVLRSF